MDGVHVSIEVAPGLIIVYELKKIVSHNVTKGSHIINNVV